MSLPLSNSQHGKCGTSNTEVLLSRNRIGIKAFWLWFGLGVNWYLDRCEGTNTPKRGGVKLGF